MKPMMAEFTEFVLPLIVIAALLLAREKYGRRSARNCQGFNAKVSASEDGSTQPNIAPSFVRWPLLVAVAAPVAEVALLAVPRAWPLVMFGAMVLLLFSIWALGFSLVCAVRSWSERKIAAFVSFALLPLIWSLGLLFHATTRPAALRLERYLEFEMALPFLKNALAKAENTPKPHVVVYWTGGFLGMVHGVAFDDSDELSLPAGTQSALWKARVSNTELGTGTFGAKRITGHYYGWSAD
jgi:hypothetical protein